MGILKCWCVWQCVGIAPNSDPSVHCTNNPGTAHVCINCGGQFTVSLVADTSAAEVNIDYVVLQPGEWGRFKGLNARRDVADTLSVMGIKAIRLGGSFCSVTKDDGEYYQWQKWTGPTFPLLPSFPLLLSLTLLPSFPLHLSLILLPSLTLLPSLPLLPSLTLLIQRVDRSGVGTRVYRSALGFIRRKQLQSDRRLGCAVSPKCVNECLEHFLFHSLTLSRAYCKKLAAQRLCSSDSLSRTGLTHSHNHTLPHTPYHLYLLL